MDNQKHLAELVSRASTALGDRLLSVILYGSAARGEFDPGHSDLNILILTSTLDMDTLRVAGPVITWWVDLGQPQPLFFTRDEFTRSTDAFPIEITDIKACNKVLHGSDPLPELAIDATQHRAQLEHELRSKLLRLRQKSMANLRDHKALLKLMENSVSTFLVLLRHTMLLKGLAAPDHRRELLAAASAAGLIHENSFAQLIDLREGKTSPKAVNSVQLFEDYLIQIQSLVASVDAI